MGTIMTTRVLALSVATLGLLASGCVEDLVAPPPAPTEAVLMHYWHFNNLPEGTLTAAVAADVSKIPGANITYPGTGTGYMDRVSPGSDLNLREGQPPGFGLRPRNPANTRELIIAASSQGYHKLKVSFAVTRSGSGALQEEFFYSVDGGAWVKVGQAYDISTAEVYQLQEFDLSTVTAVNNKANLRFRIMFLGPNAAGSSGNNRFDNFLIEGVPLS